MHRQTKDLALLERRMSLLEKIEQDKKISSAQFNLFFNAKLNRKAWEAMQEYHANMEELNYCATEEELFWISFEYDIAKGEKSTNAKKELLTLKDELLHIANQGYKYAELEEKLKTLSDENKVRNLLQDTQTTMKTDYYDIYLHALSTKSEYMKNKKLLCKIIEEIIEDSLETIS